MQVWHEALGAAEDSSRRLLEDALALAIADDVIGLRRNGLLPHQISCSPVLPLLRSDRMVPTRAAPVKFPASKSPSIMVANSPMPKGVLFSSANATVEIS